ncbi:putative reverse transcriptase domain-containing protein [Tanacetum coccineum]|uniref:Reverse transcriptase domain-containing protein n=1 Tax=Tanacetum coccineum TaxID=301880 RepID=A0ABQ5FQE6_9ASTR
MPTTRSGMTLEAIEQLIGQRVAEALVAREANSNNGNENRNETRNQNEMNGSVRGVTPVSKACTYKDFLNCQPHNFGGTEGVVVKFTTCTLVDGALTWWNSHVQTIGIDEAYEMSWKDLMKLMIEDVVRAYTVGTNEKKAYARTLPYCNKCKLHHTRQCTMKCGNCKKVGHMTRDCKAPIDATNQRAPMANQKTITCYECRKQGYYRSECLKLKSQNHRNQTGNNEAHGRVYALGGGKVNPNSNVVTGMFLLNNNYASILFDSGTDRSFVSTTFSYLIGIVTTTLAVSDAVVVGLQQEVLQLPRQGT